MSAICDTIINTHEPIKRAARLVRTTATNVGSLQQQSASTTPASVTTASGGSGANGRSAVKALNPTTLAAGNNNRTTASANTATTTSNSNTKHLLATQRRQSLQLMSDVQLKRRRRSERLYGIDGASTSATATAKMEDRNSDADDNDGYVSVSVHNQPTALKPRPPPAPALRTATTTTSPSTSKSVHYSPPQPSASATTTTTSSSSLDGCNPYDFITMELPHEWRQYLVGSSSSGRGSSSNAYDDDGQIIHNDSTPPPSIITIHPDFYLIASATSEELFGAMTSTSNGDSTDEAAVDTIATLPMTIIHCQPLNAASSVVAAAADAKNALMSEDIDGTIGGVASPSLLLPTSVEEDLLHHTYLTANAIMMMAAGVGGNMPTTTANIRTGSTNAAVAKANTAYVEHLQQLALTQTALTAGWLYAYTMIRQYQTIASVKGLLSSSSSSVSSSSTAQQQEVSSTTTTTVAVPNNNISKRPHQPPPPPPLLAELNTIVAQCRSDLLKELHYYRMLAEGVSMDRRQRWLGPIEVVGSLVWPAVVAMIREDRQIILMKKKMNMPTTRRQEHHQQQQQPLAAAYRHLASTLLLTSSDLSTHSCIKRLFTPYMSIGAIPTTPNGGHATSAMMLAAKAFREGREEDEGGNGGMGIESDDEDRNNNNGGRSDAEYSYDDNEVVAVYPATSSSRVASVANSHHNNNNVPPISRGRPFANRTPTASDLAAPTIPLMSHGGGSIGGGVLPPRPPAGPSSNIVGGGGGSPATPSAPAGTPSPFIHRVPSSKASSYLGGGGIGGGVGNASTSSIPTGSTTTTHNLPRAIIGRGTPTTPPQPDMMTTMMQASASSSSAAFVVGRGPASLSRIASSSAIAAASVVAAGRRSQLSSLASIPLMPLHRAVFVTNIVLSLLAAMVRAIGDANDNDENLTTTTTATLEASVVPPASSFPSPQTSSPTAKTILPKHHRAAKLNQLAAAIAYFSEALPSVWDALPNRGRRIPKTADELVERSLELGRGYMLMCRRVLDDHNGASARNAVNATNASAASSYVNDDNNSSVAFFDPPVPIHPTFAGLAKVVMRKAAAMVNGAVMKPTPDAKRTSSIATTAFAAAAQQQQLVLRSSSSSPRNLFTATIVPSLLEHLWSSEVPTRAWELYTTPSSPSQSLPKLPVESRDWHHRTRTRLLLLLQQMIARDGASRQLLWTAHKQLPNTTTAVPAIKTTADPLRQGNDTSGLTATATTVTHPQHQHKVDIYTDDHLAWVTYAPMLFSPPLQLVIAAANTAAANNSSGGGSSNASSNITSGKVTPIPPPTTTNVPKRGTTTTAAAGVIVPVPPLGTAPTHHQPQHQSPTTTTTSNPPPQQQHLLHNLITLLEQNDPKDGLMSTGFDHQLNTVGNGNSSGPRAMVTAMAAAAPTNNNNTTVGKNFTSVVQATLNSSGSAQPTATASNRSANNTANQQQQITQHTSHRAIGPLLAHAL